MAPNNIRVPRIPADEIPKGVRAGHAEVVRFVAVRLKPEPEIIDEQMCFASDLPRQEELFNREGFTVAITSRTRVRAVTIHGRVMRVTAPKVIVP
jgi:hypothetical protein